MATCIICNKEFEAKRSDAKICSSACRQKANRSGIKLRGEGKTVDFKSPTPIIYDAPLIEKGIRDEPQSGFVGILPSIISREKTIEPANLTIEHLNELASKPVTFPKPIKKRSIFDGIEIKESDKPLSREEQRKKNNEDYTKRNAK